MHYSTIIFHQGHYFYSHCRLSLQPFIIYFSLPSTISIFQSRRRNASQNTLCKPIRVAADSYSLSSPDLCSQLSKQKEAAAGRAAEVTDEPRVEVLGNRAALRVKPKTEQWALEMEEVPLESVDLEEVGLRLEERRSEIRRRCERFLTSEELQEAPNSREFLINKDYGLVWCNVFKAASSTWLYNFLLLAGISKKVIERSRTSPVEVARTKAYPRPSVEELRAFVASANATSFLIVREPFQRLLSAFRDKIEANHQAHYR